MISTWVYTLHLFSTLFKPNGNSVHNYFRSFSTQIYHKYLPRMLQLSGGSNFNYQQRAYPMHLFLVCVGSEAQWQRGVSTGNTMSALRWEGIQCYLFIVQHSRSMSPWIHLPASGYQDSAHPFHSSPPHNSVLMFGWSINSPKKNPDNMHLSLVMVSYLLHTKATNSLTNPLPEAPILSVLI